MTGEVKTDNNNIENIKADFIKKNGNRDFKEFSNRDVMLLLHKESMDAIQALIKRFEMHDRESKKNLQMGMTFIANHNKIIAEITSALPEKGFCEKVEDILEIDRSSGESKLKNEHTTMWHDRRWIKAIIATLVALSGLTVFDILTRLIP